MSIVIGRLSKGRAPLSRQSMYKENLLSRACTCLVLAGVFFYIYSKIWTHSAELGMRFMVVDVATFFFVATLFIKFIVDFKSIMELKIVNLLLWGLFFLIGLFFYLVSGSSDFIYGALLGFVLQKDKPHTIVKFSGILALFFFIIQFVGYRYGYFYDLTVWTRNDNTFLVRNVREALGYAHPNHATAYFSPVLIAAVYELPGFWKKFFTINAFTWYLIIYFYTGNRALFILLLACLCEPLIRKVFRTAFGKYVGLLAYPCFLLLSIFFAEIYPTGFGHFVNNLLSSRPAIWNSYIHGKISIFGSSSMSHYLMSDLNQPLDNAYIYLLVCAGWCFTLVLCVWFAFFFNQIYKQRNESLWTIVLVTFIYWLSESRFGIGVTVFYPLLFSFVLSKNSLDERSRVQR